MTRRGKPPVPPTNAQVGKPERPGITVRPQSITVVGKPGESLELGDLRRLLEDRGLNPDDWQIKGTVVNEWEAHAVISGHWVKATNHQLKVTLEPSLRQLLPQPARVDGPRYTPRRRAHNAKSILVGIFPDQQIPYHDRDLHDCVLGWLEYNRPHRGIFSGDLADLPTVSTHPTKAHELETSLQGGVDATYGVLRDYVQAAGGAEWDLIPGNHEMRLQNSILRIFPQLYGLRRPGDDLSVLSLQYLLRLDELGIRWASDPVYQQDYPYGHVTLSKNLAVYHGWVARSGAGASALTTLKHLGHSVIVGHTHRMSYTPETKHEIDGKLRVLGAWEAGTLAKVRGGLGYSVAPDWQQGFVTVRLYRDGMFKVDHALYVNGVLMWGDQRFVKGKVV